jgi:cytochrome c peroxidase
VLVKPRAYIRILLSIILIAGISIHFTKPSVSPSEKIAKHYTEQIGLLLDEIKSFEKTASQNSSQALFKQKFLLARQRFKKIAWVIEFFNPYEIKLLNGPALRRTEEDNPHVIYEPEGFQAIEEIIFSSWNKHSPENLRGLLDKMEKTLKKLHEEPGLAYKFSDATLMLALKAMLIRLSSMGISGFDSPIALYSLPEAVTTLNALSFALAQYKENFEKKDIPVYTELQKSIDKARIYIKTFSSFNTFNRIDFLKYYLDPVYNLFTRFSKPYMPVSELGRMPLNPNVVSIFDYTLFNTTFFAPNQRYQPTAARIELGRKLFYDPILSGNGSRTCASCHLPAKAFTDGRATALAINEKTSLSRNTPTLWNSVFQTRQFYDSRTATLENQLSAVVHNTDEMQGSLEQSIPKLSDHPVYGPLFREAYREDKEPVSQYNIANAIASYIRSLVALNSRFDQYMRGNNLALNQVEKNGFNIFMGKAKCGTCHYFPLFNGLVPPAFTETESEVLGVPSTASKLNPKLDPDEGKFRYTLSPVHRFSFKTPTLRNIELTAPYMHNGVYKTLEEVVEFYNNGGGSGLKIAPETQTLPATKLNLTSKEIRALIAFMKTLTDTTVNNTRRN